MRYTQDDVRRAAIEHSRKRSAAGRDIGKIPRVRNYSRRKRCRENFVRFCETYFGNLYSLPWSPTHLETARIIEETVFRGGRYAIALPRGFGKTTMALTAALWAWLYGHRRFCVLVAANDRLARTLLENIKVDLETNDLLLADFPAVCYPVRKLEGMVMRAKGQLCEKKPTRIVWEQKKIAAPLVKGALNPGGVIQVVSIDSAIRGLTHGHPTLGRIRPDLILIDDPQTDESAHSETQTRQRLEKINGAISGLPGPGVTPAIFCACTVIAQDDLADVLTNRDLSPHWRSTRQKLLVSFPKNMELWERYNNLRAESIHVDGTIRLATEFYLANREAMDEGAEVAWEHRYDRDCEVSAVQHAMNLYFNDPGTFFSEYQNDPRQADEGQSFGMNPRMLMARTYPTSRGVIPSGFETLTCGVDVQEKVLFYAVTAWNDSGGGVVIDYGTWPRRRGYVNPDAIKQTLATRYRVPDTASAVQEALKELLAYLQDGYTAADQRLAPQIVLCDAGWAVSAPGITRLSASEKCRGLLFPSYGRFYGPERRPLSEKKSTPTNLVGDEWELVTKTAQFRYKYVAFDANYWKTRVAERLVCESASPSAVCFYDPVSAVEHRMFADHILAEYCFTVEHKGRKTYQWKQKASKHNHLWDCLVLTAVGNSVLQTRVRNASRVRRRRAARPRFAVNR